MEAENQVGQAATLAALQAQLEGVHAKSHAIAGDLEAARLAMKE